MSSDQIPVPTSLDEIPGDPFNKRRKRVSGAGTFSNIQDNSRTQKGKELTQLANNTNQSTGDYLIDNQTRNEVLGLLQNTTPGNLKQAQSLITGAREGISPKFKARSATQHMYDTLLDQPGQAQTRTASLLDAYKGKI